MASIYFNAIGLISTLGSDAKETVKNLSLGHAFVGLREDTLWLRHKEDEVEGVATATSTWIGEVTDVLPMIPSHLQQHNSRNNQMLLAALKQIETQVDEAIRRYGADRIAVVQGTSTSGLEEAYKLVDSAQRGETLEGYHYQQQELGDPSSFIADYFNLKGIAYTISTACSSGARAIISGARLLQSGVVDAVIVGGADTLNPMSVNGFASLEVLSSSKCTPFAKGRDGINIGEGAALILLTKEKNRADDKAVALLGYGESSDAWHMSAPHPEGAGAKAAIKMALKKAGIKPEAVGYINLHGTATQLNDQTEAKTIQEIFGDLVPCSSTKHLTGHTLGAAGCLGAALGYVFLTHENIPLPAQDFSNRTLDEALPEFGLIQKEGQKLEKKIIASNAFAFGGNNSCLILGKVD